MTQPLTYQEIKQQIKTLEAEGKTEEANHLQIWMDNELSKAMEYQSAARGELNDFGGGPRE